MTKAVFFDWFNTLAHYYPARDELHVGACRQAGIEVSKERLSPGILLADHYYIDENNRAPVRQRSPEEQMKVFAQMERVALKEAGIEVTDELALQIMETAATSFSGTDFILFDDVMPALALLKERGMTLGVVSNLDRDLTAICQALELAPYFDFILTSRQVGAEKPQPQIFLAALQRGGVEASEAIYVGDHYNTDVVGAEDVGMQGVLLDRYDLFSHITACPRISRLDGLLNCI